MSTPEQVLSEFMDAWNAGQRPSVRAYLQRVPDGTARDELAEQLATFICIDVQRTSVRGHAHAADSLDSGWNADSEDGPSQSWEAAEAWARLDREERDDEARDFIEWALPRIEDERRRRVLELTFDGAPIADICDELGVSRANAYQLRTRAFKDLKKLKEQYDA